MNHIHVLGIDWQNDFCNDKGSLFVPGADKDAERVAALINRIGSKVEMFHFTLDSHQETHIAHPVSWVGSDGKHPGVFTIISVDDVEKGVWRASNPRLQAWYLDYVKRLRDNKRYALCIWPPHCIIGSWGHSLVPSVSDALRDWSKKRNRFVNYVTKGSNDMTEHYSAMQADVPVDADPSSKLNARLIDILQQATQIVITGQALSHCVANTIRDIVANFGTDQAKKFVLLKDASSNVTGFDKLGQDFVDEMVSKGMQIDTTANYLV